MRQRLLAVFLPILLILTVSFWLFFRPAKTLAPLPSPSPSVIATPVQGPSPSPTPKPSPLADSVHLAVPFTVQAPDGDWSEPWKEGCEEAALLMVSIYHKGDHTPDLPPEKMKQKIADMVDWELKRFGSHKNLNADEMAIIAKEYLGYEQVRVKHGATLTDIKNELRAGRPVVVPAAGQLLKNPYFKTPGPPYHVFVIKGFEGNTFITNENGTKRGRDYQYSAATLQNALHDYQEGVVMTNIPMAYLVLDQ